MTIRLDNNREIILGTDNDGVGYRTPMRVYKLFYFASIKTESPDKINTTYDIPFVTLKMHQYSRSYLVEIVANNLFVLYLISIRQKSANLSKLQKLNSHLFFTIFQQNYTDSVFNTFQYKTYRILTYFQI